MTASPQIFLSYARADAPQVEQLYQRLRQAGFQPWLDQHDILPGEQWQRSIERAIRQSTFFLACLSTHAINRRGVLQRELHTALDLWQEKLDDDIYLIPVRLEPCDPPESLRKFQWVDLFAPDGWDRLLRALQVGMERYGASSPPTTPPAAPPNPLSQIALTMMAPTGDRFETSVAANTLVNELLRAFVSQWQPDPVQAAKPQRYYLALDDAAQTRLDIAATLAEAGLGEQATLYLVAEALQPDSPVSLLIEDEQGQRYTTAVLLKTPVEQLAQAFVQQTQPLAGPGKIAADVLDALHQATARLLDRSISLYDAGIGDPNLLRIHALPEQGRR